MAFYMGGIRLLSSGAPDAISRPKVLTWMRTFAAAFAGLGLKLALAER